MKAVAVLVLSVAVGATSRAGPITRVLGLIKDLKDKVEAEGKEESESYDKYACWCEETLAEKAKEISEAKEKLPVLQNEGMQLKGRLSQLEVEMKQMEKEIAENKESQAEATAVREKEFDEYHEGKLESEQCIGALEAAIKVLTGAGAGKSGSFLGTTQEVNLLSAVAGVKAMLGRKSVALTVSKKDLEVVEHFVESPSEFVRPTRRDADGFLGLQAGNNPFGDYAPQSTQIQGILKGMYDGFTKDLEKANAEEADKQKAFEELMETKKEELATVDDSLEKFTSENGDKIKTHADVKAESDDVSGVLEVAEQFFAEAKANCKDKALEWQVRVRLRSEELAGIEKALEILESPEAQKVFAAEGASLLQVSSLPRALARKEAAKRLAALAAKDHRVGLVAIAAEVETGGHFQSVIILIDKLIKDMKAEEEEDIAHKKHCEEEIAKNEAEKEALKDTIEKLEKKIGIMTDDAKDKKDDINNAEKKMNETRGEIKELSDVREGEVEEFRKSVDDNTKAVELLDAAISALEQFYRANKLSLDLAQTATGRAEPKGEIGTPPPEARTSWEGGAEYSGGKGGTGIISILHDIKADILKDIEQSKTEEETANHKYQRQRKLLEDEIAADLKSRNTLSVSLAGHEQQLTYEEQDHSTATSDLEGAEKVSDALEKDCAWVETHFDDRGAKRKDEIAGLIEAKHILMGAAANGLDE